MKTKYHDILALYESISVRKASNAIKLHASYYHAALTKQPKVPALPYALSIEPTTSCNLRCPECPSGLRSFSRPTGQLDPLFFADLIEQVRQHVSYLTLYFQGEPFLNPSFLDMVKVASQNKIYTATSTNAHYLDRQNAENVVRSGLKRLIISIDGTTQETYESYRVGGKLEKVLEGASNILYWKKKLKLKRPYTVFQFLVVKPNEHQLEEVNQLAQKYGIDEVAFKSAQLYDYENGNALMPENTRYSRYKKQPDGKYQLKHELQNKCWKMWHSSVVTWDGKVVPCCFDKDAKYTMGDLKTSTFEQIWRGEKYQNFRRRLFTSRKQIDICANCTEGAKVWV